MTNAVHSVVVRLDPSKLENPEIDIRWELVAALSNRLGTEVVEDGFGYARNSDAMFIAFAISSPEPFISELVRVLEDERILDNRLADGATIGIAPYGQFENFSTHQIVYPLQSKGQTLED
ncbi:MAG: hypothetical protein HYU52_00765 [Acidobacteria bacterium]|nr:hypothetical protein [Acidobacteriota bacterium]